MKVCSKCKLVLEESLFNKIGRNKDGSSRIQSYCRNCKKIVWDIYYAEKENKNHHNARERTNAKVKKIELRKFVNSLKDGPCKDCGIKYQPWIMDFDHLKDKYESISVMISNKRSKEVILKEIEKCDLVCSNCHRERTYQRYENKYDVS